jgi:hypothetical protein
MTAQGFRASELMNDYVSLSDYPGYGIVQDLLFQDGQLSAIIVYPDVGYGSALLTRIRGTRAPGGSPGPERTISPTPVTRSPNSGRSTANAYTC